MTTARNILVVAHTGRADSLRTAQEVIDRLRDGGVTPVIVANDRPDLIASRADLGDIAVLDQDVPLARIELTIVLGGDGTILRAAEIVRDSTCPLMGVNLGHVGFLAEAERENLDETVRRAISREYDVEERMTIDVSVLVDDVEVHRTWALNEATIEKSQPGKMIEVVVEVGGRPLSSFGCDGVVMATPTGSTAYAFSAGGPVVWPNIDALLLVPLSAHALFARPLVVAPSSVLAVELLERTPSHGILWCDGRRSVAIEPGTRVEVTRSDVPVRLARLSRGQFTDRLVRKFDLPVTGWRGGPEAGHSA